ncbi:MAG: response regulator [Acidimicrobiales bacterium]
MTSESGSQGPWRGGGTVLIVDDSDDHRKLASRRLTDAGWDVRLASGPEEALASLVGVDLVLLDYRLPGMSGIDVLHEIRRREGPSVVMVTGMGSEHLAVEAIRAGAIDYITKDATYLQNLPRDVERAWRHHDVERRAAKLERLAMLVTATSDRDRQQTLSAIVDGAREVLRADACLLLVVHPSGLRLDASSGDVDLTHADLGDPARIVLARHDGEPVGTPVPGGTDGAGDVLETTDRLLVPIRSVDGDALGVLAVLTRESVSYPPTELRLVRTFAAFAGIALANLHRLELEQRLVAELQHLLDARRDFLAHVSHELRTPLTCIEGFAHTLLVHHDVLGEDDRRLFLTKIGDHGRALHSLVEQLLDFAAVESGRTPVDLQDVGLAAHVTGTVSGLAPLLEGREVRVDVEDVHATADPALLGRAITNLLTNAAKYSTPGGGITVRAGLSPGEHAGGGQWARIEVIDVGPGISPAELTHVFDPFWRGSALLHGTNRGTGLGLSLVREYARMLGGDVGASSSEGGGSTFWLSVPCA